MSWGCHAVKVAWDDPAVDWAACAAVIIRSTWDGVDRSKEFLRWTETVSAQSVLQNPAPTVAWNMNKRYLQDLEAAGIATIPTLWVEPGESWIPPIGEFIVKPAVGAGARNTARYSQQMQAGAYDHVSMLGQNGQTTLVQPYLPSIETEGEISLVFIDGRFSHAIRKGSFLNLDEGIIDNPWEQMTYLGLSEPSPIEMTLGSATFDMAQQRAAQPLIYGRVDLVADAHGNPLIMEMELIDPFLSLTVAPHAADNMAQAIARSI